MFILCILGFVFILITDGKEYFGHNFKIIFAILLIVIPLLTLLFVKLNKIRIKLYHFIYLIILPILGLVPIIIHPIFPSLFSYKVETVTILDEVNHPDKFNDLYIVLHLKDLSNLNNGYYQVYDPVVNKDRIIAVSDYNELVDVVLKRSRDLKLYEQSNNVVVLVKN